MQATGPIKFGAAFLAGILVALGGAVVYVKSSDSHPKTNWEVAPVSAAVTPPPAQEESLPAAAEQPEPKPVAETKPVPAPVVVPKPKVTKRPVSLEVAKPAPQIAQNLAPAKVPYDVPPPVVQSAPAPAPASVPARAVNDNVTPFAPPQAPGVSQQGPSQPQPHTVTLDAGTEIVIRLGERVSTDHNYSGDTFRAVLDKPIVRDGYIIAEKGSKVLGIITKAQKPGKMSGVAELSLALRELNTTDGQRIHIETNESLRKGPSSTGNEVAKMGGGAALGAIIGAIAGGGKGAAIGAGAGGAAGTGAVLLGHGKPAVFDTETRLTFQLSSPATITEQIN